MEGKKGEAPKNVKVYDLAARRVIDRELTEKAKDFMSRQVDAGKPFFAYIPYTMVHVPVLPAPAFDGKTGNGYWADALAQIDTYVTYFTGLEGSLRVPFIIRWPGKLPAGCVRNEIVHEMDIFPTLARVAGAKVPTDRAIDGVDQLDFFPRPVDGQLSRGAASRSIIEHGRGSCIPEETHSWIITVIDQLEPAVDSNRLVREAAPPNTNFSMLLGQSRGDTGADDRYQGTDKIAVK
jgi:hypothetical protein